MSPGQTGYMKFHVSNLSIASVVIIIIADTSNTCLHATTKTTPYQLVFGQPPHSSPFPGTTTGFVMEEAVSDILGAVHMCNMYLYHKIVQFYKAHYDHASILRSLIFCRFL